ncbi:MAG: AAA family ATPase [Steroidobacteraceae bacterium]
MYLEHFGLDELPFRLSPDPAFVYLSKQHARAKAYMESTIWFTDGFVVITGDVGSGKTTLIETVLQQLDQDVVVAQVNQTQITPTEFLQAVLVQFGFSPFKMRKGELLATLNQFLVEQYAAGRKVLLIVDEAQNLSSRVLEEIRMLSGVETTKEKVLRIILAGQPEMNERLDRPELTQLVQRVRLRFHLNVLPEDEVRSYVLHRLEVAGAKGREIFSADAFPLIHQYSGGVPRLINTLCDSAMLMAYGKDQNQITGGDVEAAVAELGWSRRVDATPASAVDFEGAGPAEPAPRNPWTGRVGMQRRRKDQEATTAAGSPERSVDNHRDAPAIEDAEPSLPGALPPAPAVRVLGRLVVTRKGRTVEELPLLPGRVLVGRTSENDLQIEEKYVSRHHCQILNDDHASTIEDLNSTNGVYIGSQRVRRHRLKDQDLIKLGDYELLYLDQRS